MKKYLSITLFILTAAIYNSAFGQYISHYTEKDRIKVDSLIDKKNGDKFIIDKQRIFITAIDKSGKLLWKTDPAIDNKLEKYRTDRPTVVYFSFGDDRTKRKKEVIWLSYSNTQFGLTKKVGRLLFKVKINNSNFENRKTTAGNMGFVLWWADQQRLIVSFSIWLLVMGWADVL